MTHFDIFYIGQLTHFMKNQTHDPHYQYMLVNDSFIFLNVYNHFYKYNSNTEFFFNIRL